MSHDGLYEKEHDRLAEKQAREAEGFNKARMMGSPDWSKMAEMIDLLIECRDALPAITKTRARLYNVCPRLDKRIEACLDPWETTPDDPNGR